MEKIVEDVCFQARAQNALRAFCRSALGLALKALRALNHARSPSETAFKQTSSTIFFFYDLSFLTAFSAFLIFYKLEAKSLTTWDEILYAQMAKEMWMKGEWFTPYLSGIPWFDKPPLYTGLTAFFYSLFGVHELSARLLSALSGVGTVVITYLFTRKMFSRAEAIVASVALLSSLHFFNHARLAMTDVTLTFFITLSLYFFYLGIEKSKYYLPMGLAISSALLTKGMAAGVIYFIITFIFFFLKYFHPSAPCHPREGGDPFIFKNRYFLTGLLISVLIPAAWFLYEYVRFGDALTALMLKGHLARVGQTLDGHEGSGLSYINAIVYKGKLWGGAALGFFGFFLIREFFSSRRDFRFMLLLSWVFCVLVLFSLSKTKLHWYIMPLYPPLFMLFASGVRQVLKDKKIIYAVPILSLVFLFYYQTTRPNKFNENENAVAKRAALHLKNVKKEGEKVFVVGPLEERVFLFYADTVVESGNAIVIPSSKTVIPSPIGARDLPPPGWVIAYQSEEFLNSHVKGRYAFRGEIEGVKFFHR